jgi:hypothetical protein
MAVGPVDTGTRYALGRTRIKHGTAYLGSRNLTTRGAVSPNRHGAWSRTDGVSGWIAIWHFAFEFVLSSLSARSGVIPRWS